MSKLVAWWGRSRKAIAGLVGAGLTWCALIAAQPAGFRAVTAVEWVGLAVAIATALGVYNTVNDPPPPSPLGTAHDGPRKGDPTVALTTPDDTDQPALA